MSSPSAITNTLNAPMTLGAVHALLTEWRRTHSATARIPYILMLDIASLIGRTPITQLKKTLGISHDQLSYFESVYRATCALNRSPLDLGTQSTDMAHTSSVQTRAGVPNANTKDHPIIGDHSPHTYATINSATTETDLSLNPAPSESRPHFIKATFAADTFSTCLQNKCVETPPSFVPDTSQYESSASADYVSSACQPNVSQHSQTLSQPPQNQQCSTRLDHEAAPLLPPTTTLSPSVVPDERAPIPITLVNQHGTTFTAALSEQQVILFMHTFIQR